LSVFQSFFSSDQLEHLNLPSQFNQNKMRVIIAIFALFSVAAWAAPVTRMSLSPAYPKSELTVTGAESSLVSRHDNDEQIRYPDRDEDIRYPDAGLYAESG
jgi:hypothetical protein